MTHILAVDYGIRKIGLALSDETGIIASPLPVMLVRNNAEAVEGIKTITDSIPQIVEILLGIPLGPNLEPTEMSEKVKSFAKKLTKAFNHKINIAFTNESLSSKQAEQGRSRKFKKTKSDSEAARIFLQEYLDHKNLMKKTN